MYEIAICDDEEKDLNQIAGMVRAIMDAESIPCKIDCYPDSTAFLELLRKEQTRYQLLLLDILMDGLDGMELAGELRRMGVTADIVFCSQNREFALLGYEVGAVRYLAKPVEEAKLREALLHAHGNSEKKKEIIVRTASGSQMISLDDILYVELSGRRATLHLGSGELNVSDTLDKLETILPSGGFFRCHQSFLVNLSRVLACRRYTLLLQGDVQIPISKTRYDGTRQALTRYASA